jgi:hypothetical protein
MLKAIWQRLRPASPPALATIWLREDRIFVQANDRTMMRTAGFWVSVGPVETLDVTTDPARVGRAVLDALARSRVEVPVPPRGTDLQAPLRKAAGVRSRRALLTGARACAVVREGGELHIEPPENGSSTGEDRGHHQSPEATPIPLGAAPTADSLGRAVLAALAKTTP